MYLSLLKSESRQVRISNEPQFKFLPEARALLLCDDTDRKERPQMHTSTNLYDPDFE